MWGYTGGILQRLDTDVHSAVLDSENEHSAVTTMMRIVMLQR